MKKRNKMTLVVVSVILVIGGFTLHFLQREGVRRLEMDIMAFYADRLYFEVIVNESHRQINSVQQMMWERESENSVSELVISRRGAAEGPPVREIVFVRSYEEALQHANTSTLAAWPSSETARALAAFNVLLHSDIERLADFEPLPGDLTFPITIEDLVDRSEDVRELWRSLPSIDPFLREAVQEERGWEEGGALRKRAIELGVWPSEDR